MDKSVGVRFQLSASIIDLLACAAIDTTPALPSVGGGFIADIALLVIKSGAYRVATVGILGAIDRAARHQGGKFGNSQSIELLAEDVVGTLLGVGYLLFQALHQSFCYLTQKHTCLAHGVEKASIGVAPQLGGEHIEHLVYHSRGCKNLVVAQIGKAGQHIGVIVLRSHRLRVLGNGLAGSRQWAWG